MFFFSEAKLKNVQAKNNKKTSVKVMLSSLKNQRETYLTNMMSDDNSTTNNTPYSNTNGQEISSPSFFDNLYQTNSIYRHMNPQQALEVSEKLPIVQQDQLSIAASCSLEAQETTVVDEPSIPLNVIDGNSD